MNFFGCGKTEFLMREVKRVISRITYFFITKVTPPFSQYSFFCNLQKHQHNNYHFLKERKKKKMAHYLAISWILVVGFLIECLESNAIVPAIIVFGDSSVDSGNNNYISTLAKSNFWPYGRDFTNGTPTGRFSNGRIPTDFISDAFRIKPTVPAYLDPAYNISDFSTGVCFASAGTGYDNLTSEVLVRSLFFTVLIRRRKFHLPFFSVFFFYSFTNAIMMINTVSNPTMETAGILQGISKAAEKLSRRKGSRKDFE